MPLGSVSTPRPHNVLLTHWLQMKSVFIDCEHQKKNPRSNTVLCHTVAICSLGLSGNNFFVVLAFHNTASYYNSTTKDHAYSRGNRPVEVVKKLGQSISQWQQNASLIRSLTRGEARCHSRPVIACLWS